MAKDSNIVHVYFRKDSGKTLNLVRVNPIQFTASEITITSGGEPDYREFEIDEEFERELTANGYLPSGPLEFNMYLSGLS